MAVIVGIISKRGLTIKVSHRNQPNNSSNIARPRPTRACALPSTFQALPSQAKQESRDSVIN